jgi:hypothetical protein
MTVQRDSYGTGVGPMSASGSKFSLLYQPYLPKDSNDTTFRLEAGAGVEYRP